METEGTVTSAPCRWNLIQFGLMCSFTMSFHAIWKFPYLVYKHTGLFLVTYYILLVLICIPVTFIQLKLGAVFSRGIVGIFSHFVPFLKGVAVGLLALSFLQTVYHAVYLGYAIYYACASLPQPYVWSYLGNVTRISSSYIYFARNPAEHYFYNDFLQVSDSIASPGSVPWYLVLSLLAAWCLVYLLVCRGPNWFGYAMYVTSPLAIFMLFTLLIFSHTAIPEAHRSLAHFFTDTQQPATLQNGAALHSNGHAETYTGHILTSQLASPLTWIRALEQHMYSLALWSGVLPTIGCHLGNRKPASNLTWLIVLLVHSMLPHLATIAIAPFIHALAVHKNLPFEKVISNGPYLLFVTLPEALSSSEVTPVWPCVLFMCFFLFALHQQALVILVVVENLNEAFHDYIKVIFKRREFFTLAVVTFAFLLGLPQLTQGGSYLTELVDMYLFRLLGILVFLSIFPMLIAYAKLDVLHLPVERACLCAWFALAGLAVTALWVYNYLIFLRPYDAEQTKFAEWGQHLGWFIAACPLIIAILAGFIHACYTTKASGCRRIISVCVTSDEEIIRNLEEEQDQDEFYANMEEGGTLKLRKKGKAKHKHKHENGAPLAKQDEIAEAAELMTEAEQAVEEAEPAEPEVEESQQMMEEECKWETEDAEMQAAMDAATEVSIEDAIEAYRESLENSCDEGEETPKAQPHRLSQYSSQDTDEEKSSRFSQISSGQVTVLSQHIDTDSRSQGLSSDCESNQPISDCETTYTVTDSQITDTTETEKIDIEVVIPTPEKGEAVRV